MSTAPSQGPKLLEVVRSRIRLKRYSLGTEEAYLGRIKRFILFHRKRQPREMGADEVTAYLSHLARDHRVAAATQNQGTGRLAVPLQGGVGRRASVADGDRAREEAEAAAGRPQPR